MYMQIRLTSFPLIGALCLGLHANGLQGEVQDPAQADGGVMELLVTRALSGDRLTLAYLRERDPLAAVRLIDQYLSTNYRPSQQALEANVLLLKKGNAFERSRAIANLTLLSTAYAVPVKAALAESFEPLDASDREARRLRDLTSRVALKKARQTLRAELTMLCGAYINEALEEARKALRADCWDSEAMLVLSNAPFEAVWEAGSDWPRAERLQLLLLRVFTRTDVDLTLTQLASYKGAEILSAALQSWWPVLIEPSERDGAYLWATVASTVEGNTIQDVLRLSIKPDDYGNVDERGEWLHFDRWFRWTYLFEMEVSHANQHAIAYQEDELRLSNPMAYQGQMPHHLPETAAMWLGVQDGGGVMVRAGNVRGVRGLPTSVRVPKASLSRQEYLDWFAGQTYHWLEEHVPQHLVPHLRFRPNLYPAPKLVLIDR